jgi:hypothetical protein
MAARGTGSKAGLTGAAAKDRGVFAGAEEGKPDGMKVSFVGDAKPGLASQAGGRAGAASKSIAGFAVVEETGIIVVVDGRVGGTTRGKAAASEFGSLGTAGAKLETTAGGVCAAAGRVSAIATVVASKERAVLSKLRIGISEKDNASRGALAAD